MFTGIIQTTATVAWLERAPNFLRYAVSLPSAFLAELKIGASVSIQGVCQTVIQVENNLVYFDAIAETLKCTTLKTLNLNHKVNIERSAKLGDEIGGHILAGHVIGTAQIADIASPSPEQRILTLTCDPNWMKYILPKGYLALNGASLTVADTHHTGKFSVHLIPETLRLTTFDQAMVGEAVNVEIDAVTQTIVTTVERVLTERSF